MSRVAVVGASQSRFGDFPALSIKELFLEAYRDLLKSIDKPFSESLIKAAFIGTLSSGGFQLGQVASLLTGYTGLANIDATRIENACASGGYALHSGIISILSGLYDIVLAIGIEKMTDLSKEKRKYWLGVSGDTEYERLAGMTFAGIYAMMANKYLYDFKIGKKYLSMIAVKNHYNGSLNPKAQMRKPISLEQALSSPSVAYPLNLFDCSLIADGAAIVLLTNEKLAREFTDKPIFIKGFGAGNDYLALHEREKITSLKATKIASEKAFKMSKIKPSDIKVAEIHDCFTIAELIAYEDLGFAKEGEGWKLIENGYTSLKGTLPVNPSGGLKSKGHPLGATGVAQVVEIFHQLRGDIDSKERQIDADLGLTHNVGGSGGSCAVTIFERGF